VKVYRRFTGQKNQKLLPQRARRITKEKQATAEDSREFVKNEPISGISENQW
jgi:hypothetical protein